MLDVVGSWTPWIAAASFLLAGVWLALQVVTVSDASAIVSRFETRSSQRAAGSQFAYVAEEDLEAAQNLIREARGADATVPPNAGGRLVAAVQTALGVLQRAELAGAVRPVALPEVSCVLVRLFCRRCFFAFSRFNSFGRLKCLIISAGSRLYGSLCNGTLYGRFHGGRVASLFG